MQMHMDAVAMPVNPLDATEEGEFVRNSLRRHCTSSRKVLR
ncbi:hypothetical protein [Bradyrhizobium sp. I1.14.4]